jgi:hypothetical protein
MARRTAYSELRLEIRTMSTANASSRWIIRLELLHLQLLSRVGLISDTVSTDIYISNSLLINK